MTSYTAAIYTILPSLPLLHYQLPSPPLSSPLSLSYTTISPLLPSLPLLHYQLPPSLPLSPLLHYQLPSPPLSYTTRSPLLHYQLPSPPLSSPLLHYQLTTSHAKYTADETMYPAQTAKVSRFQRMVHMVTCHPFPMRISTRIRSQSANLLHTSPM